MVCARRSGRYIGPRPALCAHPETALFLRFVASRDRRLDLRHAPLGAFQVAPEHARRAVFRLLGKGRLRHGPHGWHSRGAVGHRLDVMPAFRAVLVPDVGLALCWVDRRTLFRGDALHSEASASVHNLQLHGFRDDDCHDGAACRRTRSAARGHAP